MKAFYPHKSFDTGQRRNWLTALRSWITSREGKEAIITVTITLTVLLFMYTAVSKFLDYDKFVFQMRRAPLPLMHTLAPFIGWAVPIVELILVALLYLNRTRYWGMAGSLLLLASFEIYITGLKIVETQTGVHLPCTCGGIISTMGWTTHLLFNAVFIFLLALSIYYERKLRTV